MTLAALTGGFADPPRESSIAFRSVLAAMAHPGHIFQVSGARPPGPLSVAAGTVLLTLADQTTPVHLASGHAAGTVRDWIAFHTAAPMSAPDRAMFAVGAWADLLPLGRFSTGTPEYPDRAATLIVEVDALQAEGAVLRGPGILGSATLGVPDIAALAANRALFPLGLDFILTCADRLACLPRSTLVEVPPCT